MGYTLEQVTSLKFAFSKEAYMKIIRKLTAEQERLFYSVHRLDNEVTLCVKRLEAGALS